MRRGFLSGAFLALAATVLLGACALSPASTLRRDAVAHRIAEDAAAFNEAYGQAVSGQILLNILRGRDRLPRYYLAMTGINDSPSLRLEQSAGIGSVPLGDGASNWGFGALGVQSETQSRPTYSVQPFNADTLTRTAFQPIEPFVFQHYWESGWPRDILLLLMVDRLRVREGDRETAYLNEANTIFENCVDAVHTDGCDFVRALRGFIAAIDTSDPTRFAADGAPICGLLEAYALDRPVKPAENARNCPVRIAVGARLYTFELRSLDDVVYYVGELMRAGSMHAQGGVIEAQVNVRAAGLAGGGRGVPLFRIAEGAPSATTPYAASVRYAGMVYRAGPAIGRSCGAASDSGACQDDAEHGDRSSSVLSLLAELMALNQSPDAVRAPSRFFAE